MCLFIYIYLCVCAQEMITHSSVLKHLWQKTIFVDTGSGIEPQAARYSSFVSVSNWRSVIRACLLTPPLSSTAHRTLVCTTWRVEVLEAASLVWCRDRCTGPFVHSYRLPAGGLFSGIAHLCAKQLRQPVEEKEDKKKKKIPGKGVFFFFVGEKRVVVALCLK